MQNLFPHIAYLLSEHDCLILPGFGAFVVQYEKSRKNTEEGVFIPLCKSLGFNPELNSNDGLLAGLLMKERNISYNEANLIVQQFIEELRHSLSTKKTVNIPMVGTFTISENGKTLFTPLAVNLSINAPFFGFSNFHLTTLSDIIVQKENTDIQIADNKRKLFYHSINKRIIKLTGTVAATAAILLLSSTSFDNNSVPRQYAGILTSFNNPVYPEKTDQSSDNNLLILSDSIDISPKTIKKEPDSPYLYHVIVGSFASEKEALEKLPKIKKDLSPDASILKSNNNRYRVYISVFEKEADAELFAQNIRKTHSKYNDSWILRKKNNKYTE